MEELHDRLEIGQSETMTFKVEKEVIWELANRLKQEEEKEEENVTESPQEN